MSSFESSDHLSGIAGEIRRSVDSDQFDLSGYTEIRVRDFVSSAFVKPLDAPKKMIRFSFIIGGGKLVRSRYDDNLSKWLTSALRDISYTEDKSAAETFDSQGTFKQQHDTGQNLKYLIVYPHVVCSKAGPESAPKKVEDVNSPEYIVSVSELETFKEVVKARVQSWGQKKRLMKILQTNFDNFQTLEAKLVSGALLTETEQSTYDRNPGCDKEKIAWLQGEMKTMVDSNQLTPAEKKDLLQSVDNNLKLVDEEISKVNPAQVLKLQKLEEKKQGIVARKSVVEKMPTYQRRLRFGDEIQKLFLKIFPLVDLEEKGKSTSLTLADLKTLEEKPALEDNIQGLQSASKGWFEEDSDFQAMCEFEAAEARQKYIKKLKDKQPKKASSGAATSGGATKSSSSTAKYVTSASAWSSVGVAKKSGTSTQSASKSRGQSGFAALGGDDSD